MVKHGTDAVASLLPADIYQRLSTFELEILGHILQRPEPQFQLWQKVKHGKHTAMVTGLRYQSLKARFTEEDDFIGWYYYVEHEDGQVDICYENNLTALEEEQS